MKKPKPPIEIVGMIAHRIAEVTLVEPIVLNTGIISKSNLCAKNGAFKCECLKKCRK